MVVHKNVQSRRAKGSEIESLVNEARTQAGVERILVVYEESSAQIYVEGEKPRRTRPPQTRAS